MMNRRTLIAASAAALVLPRAGWALTGEPYQTGMVDGLLDAGETVFVDFYTSWCSTCKAQERVINALKDENPIYESAMRFVSVDWDIYADDPLSTWLGIPRRSTLVVLKGDQELGRIVAGTSRDDIKALMDRGLLAAKGA